MKDEGGKVKRSPGASMKCCGYGFLVFLTLLILCVPVLSQRELPQVGWQDFRECARRVAAETGKDTGIVSYQGVEFRESDLPLRVRLSASYRQWRAEGEARRAIIGFPTGAEIYNVQTPNGVCQFVEHRMHNRICHVSINCQSATEAEAARFARALLREFPGLSIERVDQGF
ncbi:MAG: hypothetical protein ACI8W8_002640 [Rhodothermales bacterium]|jgi:hypothetical protein